MAVSAADKKKRGKWIKQSREQKQPHLFQRQLALAVDITNASLNSIEDSRKVRPDMIVYDLNISNKGG